MIPPIILGLTGNKKSIAKMILVTKILDLMNTIWILITFYFPNMLEI